MRFPIRRAQVTGFELKQRVAVREDRAMSVRVDEILRRASRVTERASLAPLHALDRSSCARYGPLFEESNCSPHGAIDFLVGAFHERVEVISVAHEAAKLHTV